MNWEFFFIYKYDADAITFIIISIKDCFIFYFCIRGSEKLLRIR